MKINAVYKISDRPLIYASTGPKAWAQLPVVQEGKGYMLCHPMWQFSWSSLKLYWGLRKLLRQKNIELILLHNSEAEYRFARRFGFRSRLLNQNIHTCEHNFVVDPQPKQYDAVYIAAAKPYKRLHLAAEIEQLFVVTYFWPDVRDPNGDWDLHAFEPCIKHADFNRRRIDAQQISRVLNASHCGLALSKKEGAMWAAMEYLLTGLPIVSTPSFGGRDFFFDERYVKVVPDNPAAIAKAVAAFKEAELDPHWVRAETLKKIEPYRQQYHELCKELAAETGIADFSDYDDFHERVWDKGGIYSLKVL